MLGLLMLTSPVLSTAPGDSRPGGPAGGKGFDLPPNCTITFTEAGPAGGDTVRLSGYVDVQCGDFRIQADTIVYSTKTRKGTAEGVVVLDFGQNRITGSKLEFDLGSQTGT